MPSSFAAVPLAFPSGGSSSDMDVPLGIVYFLLARRGIAQLLQAAGDGMGEIFSLLPINARHTDHSLHNVFCLWGGGGGRI
jgi:hypothetical protein